MLTFRRLKMTARHLLLIVVLLKVSQSASGDSLSSVCATDDGALEGQLESTEDGASSLASQSDASHGGKSVSWPKTDLNQADMIIELNKGDSPAEQSTGDSQTRETLGSQVTSLSLASAPTGQWPCSACTFQNKKSARKCAICDTKRPSKARKRGIDEMS